MRGVATSGSLADPWLAWVTMSGLAPVAPDTGSTESRTLPILTVGAMLLGTLLFGFVRRRLAGVLETWRRDGAETIGGGARRDAD
jgi:LPXTG-motif cell wall-anchored protein